MERRFYDMKFIERLLKVGEKYDMRDQFYWRCGPKYGGGQFNYPASFFINCNDLFYWGCADLEEVTPENIGELEKALEDAKEAHPEGHIWGDFLFCCRMRKMRPQGAAYVEYEELWPLFDDCGPERLVEIGNPRKHPRDRKTEKLNG